MDSVLSQPADEAPETNPLQQPLSDAPFDLASWVSGIQQIKRSCTLYQRLDLLARRDELAAALIDAGKADDARTVKKLSAQITELTEAITATSMQVVLQGVTKTRFKEIAEEAADRFDDIQDAILYQIAAQVVEPADFSFEILRTLDEVIPQQTARLGQLWVEINNETPEVNVPLS